MEINEKRVTEIFLATILVLLLIVIIFLFTSQSATGKSASTSTSTTNSYNTDSYNTYYVNSYPSTQRYYNSKIYPEYYIKKDRNYLVYRSGSDRARVEGLFGRDIDKYVVYVKNDDYKGGYFTVRFYFTDYYGETFTESMTKYIKPDEEKKFLYKDIYADRYRYYDWHYKVISHTKV